MSTGMHMSDDEISAAPRRVAREVLTEGNIDLLDELLDPAFVDHNALPGSSPGPKGFKEISQILRTAFPDLRVTPQHYVVDGDIVVEHTASHGTHDGPFFGVPPTHVPVKISAIVMVRVGGDGRIAERWGHFNLLGIMQQLGMAPGGGGPSPDGAPAAPVADGGGTSTAESKALFARYVDGVWGRADASVAGELIHPEAVIPSHPGLPIGPAGTMAWVGVLRSGLPDLGVTVEAVAGNGSLVCGRLLLQGTHQGDFLGVPATDKPVVFEQMVLVETDGGRIISTWLEADLAGLMAQLGMLPG